MKERAHSHLFDKSPDGFLVLQNNQILEGNRAALALLGCKGSKALNGKSLVDFSTDYQPDGLSSSQAWQFYLDEAKQEGNSRFDWTLGSADNEKWVEVSMGRLDARSGTFLVNLRDINERKLKEHRTNLRSARMIIQNQILSELTRLNDRSDPEEYYRLFTGTIGQYPDIDRSCTWTFDQKRRTLSLSSVHLDGKPVDHRDQLRVTSAGYPRFFAHLKGPIIAHNALTDDRTNEFKADYLEPNKIRSIMFAPVTLGENLFGLVSLERTGKLKKWEVEEQSFVVTVAEILTKHIEQQQRLAAEIKLKHSEERLNSLVVNARDAIAISDVDVNFFYASPGVQHFLGYTPKEFTRLNGAKLVHPKHRGISRPVFAECLSEPGKAVQTEFLFKHKAGHYIFLDITFYNLLHDEAVKGVVMNFRDITERKRSEQKLIQVNQEIKKSQSLMQQKVEEQEKTLRLFKKYVPEEVVQRAMEASEDSILEGENRRVAVLFCDIRGFTPMSEQMKPKEVVAFLNDYYSVMTEIVKRHSGTVMQFVGDEIFATFGAPVDHPDNEVNAVSSACEMQQMVEYLSSKAGRTIEVGIGINAGEVVAGNLGSEDRIGYSVSGDTVNTGKRIETLTKDKGSLILISKSVYEKTRKMIKTKAWDPVLVKGKKEKIRVYEVQGRVEPD